MNFTPPHRPPPPPPAWLTWIQFGLITSGAALVTLGRASPAWWDWSAATSEAFVVIGATAFVGAMAILGWIVGHAWRRSLNRRHVLQLAAYGAAVASVLVGAGLGAWMGAGTVSAERYVSLRHAHISLNVLGFASLTVVGTLVTLLPTALRIRIPSWPGRTVLASFVIGLLAQLLGWGVASAPLRALGGALYAAGAVGLAALVVSALRAERRWRPPLAALHMVAAAAWFVYGSLGLAWALARDGFDRYRTTFLIAFVGGWLVQVLLGAWAYLLPMQRPAHPDERRRMLAAFEAAAPVQLVLLNGGLVLLAVRGAGWVGPGLGDLGALATGAGVAIALAKAWLFPWLGSVGAGRARAVWGS
jgi:nitrite reductase (NO-forming)